SFSWQELPNLYDDYDRAARIFSGEEVIENEKESRHIKRLYEASQIKETKKSIPVQFSHVAMLSQIFGDDDKVVETLKRTGHYRVERENLILERMRLARNWAMHYVPEKDRIGLLEDYKQAKVKLSNAQKTFLEQVSGYLAGGERTSDDIQNHIFKTAKETGLPLKTAFQAIYLSMLGTTRGPKAGTLLASLDKDWVLKRFRDLGR
ncbi:MAG: hypothetical protein ACE5HY_02460, partial [Candidatus Hydrothermarchaeales archaeon]